MNLKIDFYEHLKQSFLDFFTISWFLYLQLYEVYFYLITLQKLKELLLFYFHEKIAKI